MTLRLTIIRQESIPLEVPNILPETVCGRTVGEIGDIPILAGNRRVPLKDHFHVEGDAADAMIEWCGDLSGVHRIGAGMSQGSMQIQGDAGRHLGSRMHDGQIVALGDAGDWAGAEMIGGLLDIRGNADDLVGGAYRGSLRGMSGGTILVHGNAGAELGHAMRRGLIAVGGDCGDLAGFNMLAGTIVLAGSHGVRLGACMRRGTIVVLASQPQLGPTFVYGCTDRLLAWQLILRELRRLRFSLPPPPDPEVFRVYHGDVVEGGRGEILAAIESPKESALNTSSVGS